MTTSNSGQSNVHGSTISHLSLVSQKVNTESDAQILQDSVQTHGKSKTFLIGLISCSTLLILLLMSWAALVVGLVFTLIFAGWVAAAKQWQNLTTACKVWMRGIW